MTGTVNPRLHTWWLSNPFTKPSDNMLGFVQEILAVPNSIYQRKPVHHLVMSARSVDDGNSRSTHCQRRRVPERIASISDLVGPAIETGPL